MTRPPPIPVLEIGGTHAVGALVSADGWSVELGTRTPVDAQSDAETILASFAAAGHELAAPTGCAWGVAMPDPFDYARGIATFQNVGKYDALYGVDVGQALRERLPQRPARIAFLNDADAFVLGEWTAGLARGFRRCVGITLGTGLGTGWLIDGEITDSAPGVPPLGRARTISYAGRSLEETVSSRGLTRIYAEQCAEPGVDVAEICRRARQGERAADDTIRLAFTGLGEGLGPAIQTFGADVVVVGGSMAASWDLFEPWFRLGYRAGSADPEPPPVFVSSATERAALIGAARFAADTEPR